MLVCGCRYVPGTSVGFRGNYHATDKVLVKNFPLNQTTLAARVPVLSHAELRVESRLARGLMVSAQMAAAEEPRCSKCQ